MGNERLLRLPELVMSAWVLAALATSVWAHGGSFQEISLDGDPELKQAVIVAAQRYVRTTKPPVSFDSVDGRIAVNFDKGRRLSVLLDFRPFGTEGRVEIVGFKDEERRSPPGTGRRVSLEEARRGAERALHEIPEAQRRELHFLGSTLIGGIYNFRWIRRVQGIPVLGGEELNVAVDAPTGQIIGWDLGIFDFPSHEIETRPRLATPEAAARALAESSRWGAGTLKVPEGFRPFLVVSARDLHWAVLLVNEKMGPDRFRAFALVHDRTGEVQALGPSPELEELAAARE